jgi:hypothetical protein
MPAREYQIIAVDAENVEDGVRDPKLTALRAQGYRVVASLGVQHRGKPSLALVMEPPMQGEERTVVREPDPPPPVLEPSPRAFTTRDWIVLVLAVVVIVGQVVQFLR